LKASGIHEVEVREEALQQGDPLCSPDPGCGIFLYTDAEDAYLAGDSLGRIGKPAEKVGYEAAEDLIKQASTQAPIDRHLGDQLIVYMSLAEGQSRIRVSELTMHMLTAIEVSEKITGASFQVEGSLNQPATITCRGVGQVNNAL
jgi:RNA 3'-terminal phosphate cyclase (ATP)